MRRQTPDAALYILDVIDELDDDFAKRYMSFLSPQRREKALSYRFPQDRNLSVAVYLLLRLALNETGGIAEPVSFEFGAAGKPFLRDYPQVHFSLSHCKRAAACAVSDTEIGVDVQEITPVSDALARRVLTASEYAAFNESQRPNELFCGLWAKKESFLKKNGQGIAVDLTALPADGIADAMPFKGAGYYGCVCGAYAKPRHVREREIVWGINGYYDIS